MGTVESSQARGNETTTSGATTKVNTKSSSNMSLRGQKSITIAEKNEKIAAPTPVTTTTVSAAAYSTAAVAVAGTAIVPSVDVDDAQRLDDPSHNNNATTAAEEDSVPTTDEETASIVHSSDDEDDGDDSVADDYDDYDNVSLYEPEEEELDIALEERRLILEDALRLKQYAAFHLRPEVPVTTTDSTACGRNYFDRPSAVPQIEREDDEAEAERALIMQDLEALKEAAGHHLHPERPVAPTSAACARNYFLRPSAPVMEEPESPEEKEERERIMDDVAQLKAYASYHLHPERPVHDDEPDATARGRNYFTRASAPEYDDFDDMLEREQILREISALKTYAAFHLHPERPVETTDPTIFGRDYYRRPSAPEQEDVEEMAERARILEEAAALKQYASYHMHPERPVTPTSVACARNYFDRPSAPEVESSEEMEERARILEETSLLKSYATFHLHPERPVESTPADPTSFGRNYFNRHSAPETETVEEMEERAKVLEEAGLLKQHATFHLHPERPVDADDVDPTVFGRNYFARVSAPDQETEEEMEERRVILEEAAKLKIYAGYHLHPERPVPATSVACARGYFERVSAPEQESVEDMEERTRILEEAASLKKYAEFHLHPECPVSNDDTAACGRNYFTRPSAEEYDDDYDNILERNKILQEAAELKKYAAFHLHPERPVETTDPTVFGRDYFRRPSASEQDDSAEEMLERARILKEASDLKTLASYHMHPERPVPRTAAACARNYFTRFDAPDQVSLEEAEERALVLQEAVELKKLAAYHLHPERPVPETTAGEARNYFGRASAPEQETKEEMEERREILAEAAELRKYAKFHLHPELSVEVDDPTASGRNYFTRPSAPLAAAVHSVGHSLQATSAMATDSEVFEDSYGQHHAFEMDEEDDDNVTDVDLHKTLAAGLKHLGAMGVGGTRGDFISHMDGTKNQQKNEASGEDEEEEGKLSRSPSSVMLFGFEETSY